VDVSQQWKAHASTSALQAIEGGETQKASTSTAAVSEVNTCECDAMTVPEKLEQCTYAFTGRVSEVSPAKKGTQTILFDVDEIFKGDPKPDMEVQEEMTGTDCDITFEAGQNYLVYSRWEWGHVFTTRCMGTKLLEKINKNALGPSEEAKEKLYRYLHNACMGRLDTSCCLGSVKAMQSGYYVPEPEDGCPSGSVPDRLRCAGSYTWCISATEKRHEMAPH